MNTMVKIMVREDKDERGEMGFILRWVCEDGFPFLFFYNCQGEILFGERWVLFGIVLLRFFFF